MSSQTHTAQLKWHNTLPEDFTPRRVPTTLEPVIKTARAVSTTGRKRHSASLEGLNLLKIPMDGSMNAAQSSTEAGKVSASGVPSPTKKHRPTNSSSNEKTPTKLTRSAIISGKASDSGMQTPPSSTGATKRRGRAPQRMTSANKGSLRVLSPPQTSPAKLRTTSTSTLNSDYSAHKGKLVTGDGHSRSSEQCLQKTLFWDDGLDPGRNGGQLQFDWNLLRGNALNEDVSDSIFTSNSSMNRCDVSPVRIDAASDSAHFSFMQSDYSDFAPTAVDPTLLFSEPSSAASSMVDGFSDRRNNHTPSQRPYQHQTLQREREQEERLKRWHQTQQESAKSRKELKNSKSRESDPRLVMPLAFRRPSSIPRQFGRAERKEENMKPLDASSRPTIARSHTSPPKSTKTRTDVVLAIAADGRAQAKATVVYEYDILTTAEEFNAGGWDSLEESDSSFDGDTPRGLAPDGGEYLSYRRRTYRTDDTKPSAKAPQANAIPKTPPKPFGLAFPAAIGRSRMDSSPRLPTPFKSSPPPSVSLGELKRARSSIIATISQFENDDDVSEAETVVDESVELRLGDEVSGDALTALKRMLARSRRSDVSPLEIPTMALPGSVVKFHTYNTHNSADTSIVGPLGDPFGSSTSLIKLLSKDQTPRKSRRRPLADGGFHHGDGFGNTSPTTVTDPDCASDHDVSDIEGDATGETRCICNQQDDGGKTMVQCESCENWLHLGCLGYNRRTLPKVFICTYCINETPRPKIRTRGLKRVKSSPVFHETNSNRISRRTGRPNSP